MTKKELHTKIKQLSLNLAKLKNIKTDSRLLEAQIKLEELKEQVWAEREQEIDQREKEIETLTLQYKTPIRKSSKFEPSEALKGWLKNYSSGVSEGGTWKIIWASPKAQYVIIREPGGMFWSSRQAVYGRTSHELIQVVDSERWTRRNCLLSFEGRLSKEKKQQMIDLALQKEGS